MQDSNYPHTVDDESFVAAQAEWDAIATVEIAERSDTGVDGIPCSVTQQVILPEVTVESVIEHFRWDDKLPHFKRNIRPHAEYGNWRSCLLRLFGPPNLKPELTNDRDLLFAMALWPLENSNEVHISMLYTVYRNLVRTQFNPARFGNHWDDIGFQGVDPSTDLRGSGCLGLLNLLYLTTTTKYASLCRKIYTLSRHPVQNFPFCVMSLNMTRIVIQVLRQGRLNRLSNRISDVIYIFNEFYVAAFWYLYTQWYNGNKTIHDSGYVIKEVETRCCKKPEAVLSELYDLVDGNSNPVQCSQQILSFTNMDNL